MALKFLGQVEGSDRRARVYKNPEWDEHVVKFYEAEEYQTEADYHCPDFQDAVKTALHFIGE